MLSEKPDRRGATMSVSDRETDWKMVADGDPILASATRRRLRRDCVLREALVIGTHYAPPCAGRIVAEGGGFAFRAQR